MIPYESSLMTLRFTGPNLKESGIAIYDLGIILICIQRAINKASLARTGRLYKGAIATREHRQEISLQLGSRQKSSDCYGLIPVVSGPELIDTIHYCAKLLFDSLFAYATGKVLDKLLNERSKEAQTATSSMYNDVSSIVGRIDHRGSIHGIEIGMPTINYDNIISFDIETRYNIEALNAEYFLGEAITIKASVFKLYPNMDMVTVRKSTHGKCNIFLSEKDFRKIRYDRKPGRIISFIGRPRHRLGADLSDYSEFEANHISFSAHP